MIPPIVEASIANLRGMIATDVTEIQTRLKLPPQQLAKVDRILWRSIDRCMAVLVKYGVTAEKRPSYTTLISIRSAMDGIHTDTHRQLERILSDSQMQTIHELGERMTRKVQAILFRG